MQRTDTVATNNTAGGDNNNQQPQPGRLPRSRTDMPQEPLVRFNVDSVLRAIVGMCSLSAVPPQRQQQQGWKGPEISLRWGPGGPPPCPVLVRAATCTRSSSAAAPSLAPAAALGERCCHCTPIVLIVGCSAALYDAAGSFGIAVRSSLSTWHHHHNRATSRG